MIAPPSVLTLGLLLCWGTVVGLDLASVPQGLLARPLVAASVAGWFLGDVEAGLRVGALLELFALDVLPVGASRYPEYGPASIGAVLLANALPAPAGMGVAALLGLGLALFAGWTLDWLRHANARHVHRLADALHTGSPAVIRRLQYAGLGRDTLRSLGVTTLAMLSALLIAGWWGPSTPLPPQLTPVMVGVGAAAALTGALRTAGTGRRLAWLGVGVAAGLALVFTVAA
ncbi:MAG TPA: PTS sugar transporter subunit IIC [Gemmatimonadales bacterium]|nr:PTS sugar transporter subunit IIC [Gemmatimonadales bacterium]